MRNREDFWKSKFVYDIAKDPDEELSTKYFNSF